MNDRLDPGMREASRLTRAGRLTEATALLQRMLQRRRNPHSPLQYWKRAADD